MSRIDMTKERYKELLSMSAITITHWQEVVAGDLHYRPTVDCPACKKYLYQYTPCKGCYIAEQTEYDLCINTPAHDYITLHYQYYKLHNWDIAIELKAAAQDVLDFLIGLQKQVIKDRIDYWSHILQEKHGLCHNFTLLGDLN